MQSISSLAKMDTVENIIIFIADSLRFDSLPDAVREQGLTARTISASTFTGSSVPSMMTGMYPSTHKVWDFSDTLPKQPVLLNRSHDGLTTQNVWQNLPPEQRPPLRMLRLREETTLQSISNEGPSLIVIHDRGAHGPYDYTNTEWEKSPTFFEDHSNNQARLQTLYHRGCESTGQRFLKLVKKYDLNETLLVFTSDHGELLGERNRGGVFGHGTPICPELVTVPTVFVGAGLPKGDTLNGLLSGADLAPTLLAAQNREIPDYVEGVDCWTTTPPSQRIVRSEMWSHTGSLTYGGCSVWDENGGVVGHHGSRLRRIGFAYHRKVVDGAQAPAIRSFSPAQNWHLIRSFGRQEVKYGTPNKNIRDDLIESFSVGDTKYEIAEPDAEQLEALGYLS